MTGFFEVFEPVECYKSTVNIMIMFVLLRNPICRDTRKISDPFSNFIFIARFFIIVHTSSTKALKIQGDLVTELYDVIRFRWIQ